MKGSEVPGVIGIILIALVAAGLIYLLIEFIFVNLIPLFASGSGPVVSRDLAGLITISGIAPYKITIHYTANDVILYNVSINSRVVTVQTLQNNPRPLTIQGNIAQYATSKIAIGDMDTFIMNAKDFVIEKSTILTPNRQNQYSVTGK